MLFKFDYKEDLMNMAVERQRVFTLKTLKSEKVAAMEYMKLNPIVKYTPRVYQQAVEEDEDSDVSEEVTEVDESSHALVGDPVAD